MKKILLILILCIITVLVSCDLDNIFIKIPPSIPPIEPSPCSKLSAYGTGVVLGPQMNFRFLEEKFGDAQILDTCWCGRRKFLHYDTTFGELYSGGIVDKGGSSGDSIFTIENNKISIFNLNEFYLLNSSRDIKHSNMRVIPEIKISLEPGPISQNSEPIRIAILDEGIRKEVIDTIHSSSHDRVRISNFASDTIQSSHGEYVVKALLEQLDFSDNQKYIIDVYDIVDSFKGDQAIFGYRTACLLCNVFKDGKYRYINMSFGFGQMPFQIESEIESGITSNPEIIATAALGNMNESLSNDYSIKCSPNLQTLLSRNVPILSRAYGRINTFKSEVDMQAIISSELLNDIILFTSTNEMQAYPAQFSSCFPDNIIPVIGLSENLDALWKTNLDFGSNYTIHELAYGENAILSKTENGAQAGTSYAAPRLLAKIINNGVSRSEDESFTIGEETLKVKIIND